LASAIDSLPEAGDRCALLYRAQDAVGRPLGDEEQYRISAYVDCRDTHRPRPLSPRPVAAAMGRGLVHRGAPDRLPAANPLSSEVLQVQHLFYIWL